MKFLVKVKLRLVINVQEILCGRSKIVTLNFAKKITGNDKLETESSFHPERYSMLSWVVNQLIAWLA